MKPAILANILSKCQQVIYLMVYICIALQPMVKVKPKDLLSNIKLNTQNRYEKQNLLNAKPLRRFCF
jgi:hypothetical protein